MKFLFMAPPAFASGPAQYSSLWNLFISTILKIMKERLKIQASGPAGFTPWDRLNIPVCETSSSINPRFVTALEKVFLTFYMICKAGQNQKKNSGHQTNDVVFFGLLYVLRFRSFHPEPAYWIRSGILMKLPQSSHRSLFFFQAYTAFWKPLIKAREAWSSYAIPRSSYQTVHPFSGSAAFARNRLTESEVEPSFYYLCLNGKLSISKRKLFKLFESPLADSRERS